MENVYDISKICRTCLNETKDMKAIFEVTISEEHNVRITDFIRRLTSLKITKCENLPDNICVFCVEELCKAFNFAQMCISADYKLKLNKRSVLQNGEVQSPQYTVAQDFQVSLMNNKENNANIVSNIGAADASFAVSVDEKNSRDEIIIIRNWSDDQGQVEFIENHDTNDQDANNYVDNDSFKEESTEEHNINTNRLGYVRKRHYTRKFKCHACPESFANRTKLIRHEQLHNPKNPYKCELCNKTFLKINQLKMHSRSHIKNEDKQFVCNDCGQRFSYLYLLEKHSYKHQDRKPFPCTQCEKGCVTAESLKRHMKTHDENYVRKSHVCDICAKEFPYPSFLAEHMKNHTGEKPFLCSICGKGFRQSGTLHYHMRSHTGSRPYSCKVCGNSFSSPGVLRVHMRTHTNERPYVCDICGMAFRQSTDMKSHKRTHTGDKPVLCTICGKRFSSTGQLTVHIRSHTGEKPFSCGVCSKAFATKTILVKHERIHTGERPYKCKICGKAFNQSSTLKTHSNTHKVCSKYREETVAYCVIEAEYNGAKTDAVLPAPVPMVQN